MKILEKIFNNFTIKKKERVVAEVVQFCFSKTYKFLKKKLNTKEIKEIILPQALPSTLPLIKKKFLSLPMSSSDFYYCVLVVGLSVATVKGLIDMSFPIKNIPAVAHEIEDANDSPAPVKLPNNGSDEEEKPKKVLPLHLCCPLCPHRSIGRYVIYKKKNKDISQSLDISPGDIGQITKKLKGWDQALVNFSVEVPSRFQKLDTKSMVANVFNEGVVIFE